MIRTILLYPLWRWLHQATCRHEYESLVFRLERGIIIRKCWSCGKDLGK